jgi:hypothetical protein
MTMANCSACGKDVASGARSCPHCGKDFPAGGLSAPLKWFLFIVVFFLVAIILANITKAGEIHVWKDENGVTHIGDPPAPGDSNKPADIKTYKSEKEDPVALEKHKRATKRKARTEDIDREYRQEKEDIEARWNEREKQWAIERCEEARRNKSRYMNEYMTATSEHGRQYWKQKLDEIHAICSKVP